MLESFITNGTNGNVAHHHSLMEKCMSVFFHVLHFIQVAIHHSELRSIIANIPWSFWSPQVFEWVHNILVAPSWMATGQRPHLAASQIWLHRTYNWCLNAFYWEINSKSTHHLEKYTLHEALNYDLFGPHVSSMGHCTCQTKAPDFMAKWC